MMAQGIPASYDNWKLMDGMEDCIPEEVLMNHKHERLSDQGASCKDCRHCDQYSDGTWYCTETGVDGIDPEDGFCDDDIVIPRPHL